VSDEYRPLEDRLVTAAVTLARTPEAMDALRRGIPVRRDLLVADQLRVLGERPEGPDFVLAEEAAIRLEVGSDNGSKETGEPHSWRPVSLQDVGREPAAQPSVGGLVYAGLRHVLVGEPESLKTWAAASLVVEALAGGRSALYVDCENGAAEMRERFLALGLSEDDLERVPYISPAEPMTDPAVLGEVEMLLAVVEPALVVVDSFDALLELHAADPNSTVDVSRFYRTVVDPLRATGAAVVLLDHVAKDTKTRGRWAIGSQRKVGVAEVALGFELVQPFGRGRTGLAHVFTRKDRRGYLPRPRAADLELRSDEATGAVSWTWKQPAGEPAEGAFRPTRLMEKVSRYVEAHVAEEKVPRSAVEEHVSGKRQYVREAMDRLVHEGFLEETAGPRGARLLTSLRPFREDADDGN
jgi:hypothetical protein